MRITIMGGLGNQLFQVNAIYYYKNINPNEAVKAVSLNTQFLNVFRKLRGVTSHRVHPVISKLSDFEIEEVDVLTLVMLLFSKYVKYSFFRHMWTESNPRFYLDQKNLTLRSYFQNSIPISPLLVNDLRAYYGCREMHDRIAIHARFGDSSFKTLPDKYYVNALLLLNASSINSIVLICNNIEQGRLLASRQLSCYLIDIISTDLDSDFKYMMSSKYLVLSNSTYSWWASELSSVHQTIVCPPNSSFSDHDFSPPSLKNRILCGNS